MKHLIAGRTIMLCLAGILWAGAALAEQTRQSHRYLFIVETSRAMKRPMPAAVASVQKLLASGLGKRLSPGDTIGLWTFDSELHAGLFPMQVWTEQTRETVGKLAVDFLKQQKLRGTARPDQFMPELARLIDASESLTVLIYSTGAQPIKGTPFDDSINKIFDLHHEELNDARVPFVTVLLCRKGQIVRCAMNSATDVDVPALPEERSPATGERPSIPTNAAMKKMISATAVTKTNAPLIVDYSQSNTLQIASGAAGREGAASITGQTVATPAVQKVAPISNAAQEQKTVAMKALPPPANMVVTTAVTNVPVLEAAVVSSAATSSVAGEGMLEYSLVSNASPAFDPLNPASNTDSSVRKHLIWLLVGGGLVLVVALFLIRQLVIGASKKSQVSLITRSLERKRR